MLTMKKLERVLWILFRAMIPAIVEGAHGIGKSSLIYNLWLKEAKRRKEVPADDRVSSFNAGAYFRDQVYDKSRFWIWAFTTNNVAMDELIGYPDRDRPWRDADNLAWTMASNMASDPEQAIAFYRRIQPEIMKERGLSNEDRDRVLLKYIRSTQFLPPVDHEGGGIFFPDELNLGNPHIERALMSIVQEGRFLDWTMPNDIWIVTSQNPAVGEYQSRRLNRPTVDRFCHLGVKTELKESIELFREMDLHPAVQNTLIKHGDEVHNVHEQDLEFEISVDSNNRGMEMASKVLEVITDKELDDLGLGLLRGLVGETTGNRIFKEAKAERDFELNLDEVLDHYGVDLETWDNDMAYKQVPMTPVRKKVLKIARNSATVRVDIISSVLRQALDWAIKLNKKVEDRYGDEFDCENYDHEPEDKKHCLNMLVFLTDISSELSKNFLDQDIMQARCFPGSLFGVSKSKLAADLSRHINSKEEEEANAA